MKNRIEDIYDFYQGKTVLVTGHTGFKGSWLSFWLNLMGANVIGYSLNPQNEHDFFSISRLNNKIVDLRGDIRSRTKISKVFNEYQPEIVFHLAAQPLVGESYKKPYYTYSTNILGTINILEAFQNCLSCKVGVIITTDKVYKNIESKNGYKESDTLGGYDPYSSSKAAVELIVESWRSSFIDSKKSPKSLSTARAGNVIGGGDWSKNRLIPDIVKSIESTKVITVRNPNATRPWQHVLEPLHGYLILGKSMYLESDKYSGAWNFGPDLNSQKKVLELVKEFTKLFNFNRIEINDQSLFHETSFLNLNSQKARKELSWRNVLNFEETLQFTAYWYKNYKRSGAVKMITFQIQEFEKHLFGVERL